MSEFEREERYVVIKLSHLSGQQGDMLDGFLRSSGIRPVEGLVVEKDWPEYEPTYKAIEERVDPSKTTTAPPSDTVRLNYLATNPKGGEINVDGVVRPCIFWGLSAAPEYTLREAIDLVMAAKKS